MAELLAIGEGLLFPDKHGHVEQHMLREIQKAVKGAGVQKVKMHRFRDTFAVNKLRDGVDVRTLQRWLGHETLEQVMEYCAWLDSQSEAARRHANREDIRYRAPALPAMKKKGGNDRLRHEQASRPENGKSHPQRHRRRCRSWDALFLILTSAWPASSYHGFRPQKTITFCVYLSKSPKSR